MDQEKNNTSSKNRRCNNLLLHYRKSHSFFYCFLLFFFSFCFVQRLRSKNQRNKMFYCHLKATPFVQKDRQTNRQTGASNREAARRSSLRRDSIKNVLQQQQRQITFMRHIYYTVFYRVNNKSAHFINKKKSQICITLKNQTCSYYYKITTLIYRCKNRLS